MNCIVHRIAKSQTQLRDFIFLGSRITTDSGCSYEIKRHLLLGREWASLVAQLVKNLPAMGRSAEEGKATHSSTLAWRIHGLYSPWG